jgi:hypothetical protein
MTMPDADEELSPRVHRLDEEEEEQREENEQNKRRRTEQGRYDPRVRSVLRLSS